MISIITTSINPEYLSKMEASIEKTTNIDFEIIVIDNSVEKVSISKAYNIGAAKSKFEYLVFVHEDVEFLNSQWDAQLITILEEKKIGIVGLAGSTYLPSVPSGWYLPIEDFNNVYIHQEFKYTNKPVRFDNQGKDLTPVYLLDGVFLAMRKEVWEEFPFNEQLDGFHAYDVDISQRVSVQYQNLFTKKIELVHFSEGKVDKNYFDALLASKKDFLKFNYPTRDFQLEYRILKQFYSHLRCYYEKKDCISKITPFIKIKYLGIKGFVFFYLMLKSER